MNKTIDIYTFLSKFLGCGNTSTQNQETAEISQTYNEKGCLGEFDTLRTYQRQKRQGLATDHRRDEAV